MHLTLITVNYNGSEDTIRLLKSLKSNNDQDFGIIVVDNASDQENRRKLSDWVDNNYSKVQILWSRENLGFSGGCNLGIKEALQNGSEWVLLINPDSWVENDFIAHLKLILSRSEGLLGIAIREGDTTPTNDPGRTGKTVYKGIVEWLKPTLRHEYRIMNNESEIKDQNSIFSIRNSVFYVVGAAMAIHKSVFKKIGYLDENYFLYFEDADFSLRARRAGVPILFTENEDSMIYHTVSTSTKKLGSSLLLRYHYRNALYFNQKNGQGYIKFLVWPWSIVIILKQILKVMIYHNPEQSLAILKGIIDFYLGRMGKIQ